MRECAAARSAVVDRRHSRPAVMSLELHQVLDRVSYPMLPSPPSPLVVVAFCRWLFALVVVAVFAFAVKLAAIVGSGPVFIVRSMSHSDLECGGPVCGQPLVKKGHRPGRENATTRSVEPVGDTLLPARTDLVDCQSAEVARGAWKPPRDLPRLLPPEALSAAGRQVVVCPRRQMRLGRWTRSLAQLRGHAAVDTALLRSRSQEKLRFTA